MHTHLTSLTSCVSFYWEHSSLICSGAYFISSLQVPSPKTLLLWSPSYHSHSHHHPHLTHNNQLLPFVRLVLDSCSGGHCITATLFLPLSPQAISTWGKGWTHWEGPVSSRGALLLPIESPPVTPRTTAWNRFMSGTTIHDPFTKYTVLLVLSCLWTPPTSLNTHAA